MHYCTTLAAILLTCSLHAQITINKAAKDTTIKIGAQTITIKQLTDSLASYQFTTVFANKMPNALQNYNAKLLNTKPASKGLVSSESSVDGMPIIQPTTELIKTFTMPNGSVVTIQKQTTENVQQSVPNWGAYYKLSRADTMSNALKMLTTNNFK